MVKDLTQEIVSYRLREEILQKQENIKKKMKTEIHQLSLGACNCYLIKEDGLILIDGGSPNQGKRFLKELRSLSLEPKDISLLILTHGHWDHFGSANEIKELSGCKLAINQHEKDWVEQALKPLPPGTTLWGKILGTMMKISMPFVKLPRASVDLVLEDNEFPLESYGIRGNVLYTPGHSSGSMTVLLDTGEAFVGDLAMSGFPKLIGKGMPIFAEDVQAVKASWHLILNRGARWIYPAHGRPFKADVLKNQL